jgi:molybdenum cofactor cytidylyltransferase
MMLTANMSLAIVPAAGRAERFGSAKLLADIGGEPLIARTLRSLLDGGVGTVALVVAPGSPLIDLREPHDVFGAPAVEIVINPDPDRGMFSSIQAGLVSGEPDIILVLPADMPFVRAATVAGVLDAAAARDAVILPTCRGSHGHPIGLPGSVRDAMLEADPRSSLKQVLVASGLEHREWLTSDAGVLRDVDFPQDLAHPG